MVHYDGREQDVLQYTRELELSALSADAVRCNYVLRRNMQ